MTDRNLSQEERHQILLFRHRVIVDSQEVYVGEDWGKANQIFISNAQRLDVRLVKHIVQKQAVPVYHNPRAVRWDEV